jgi:hypothetical protein
MRITIKFVGLRLKALIKRINGDNEKVAEGNKMKGALICKRYINYDLDRKPTRLGM